MLYNLAYYRIYCKQGCSYIIVKYALIVLLLVLSLISDYKTYKIKNAILLPFIISGLLVNFIYDGFYGILYSLSGILVPILLLILLYALRMLGAGDIKLFSAIGSIMGMKFVLYAIAGSFLCGGIIAIAVICLKRNAKQRLMHLFTYIKNCFLTLSLQPYGDFKNKSDGSVFHFSYAIASGTLILFIMLFYVQGFGFFHF